VCKTFGKCEKVGGIVIQILFVFLPSGKCNTQFLAEPDLKINLRSTKRQEAFKILRKCTK
jgi:hypothetical protein